MLSPQFDTYKEITNIVHGKVADVGFGTGFGTHLLTVNAEKVTGYEIDKDALAFAREVFPFNKVEFQYGDILKGINGKYDYVVMVDVIEHVKNDNLLVKNVNEMLKESGTFICSTPNRNSRYRKSEGHIREYATTDLKFLLNKVFSDVRICNYKLKKIISLYENPLIAICGRG